MAFRCLVSQTVGKLIAMPPEMMIPHIDGGLVCKVRFHPDHLQEAKALSKPLFPGAVDGVPEDPIVSRHMIRAFVEARCYPEIITNKNCIPLGVPKGLQDGCGLGSGDCLFSWNAPIGVSEIVEPMFVPVGQDAREPKATPAEDRVTAELASITIASQDGTLHWEPPSPSDLVLETAI